MNRNNADNQESSELCLMSPMKRSLSIFSSRKQEEHAGNIDLSGLLSPKLEKALMKDCKFFSPVRSMSFALRQSFTISPSLRKSPQSFKKNPRKEEEGDKDEEDEDDEHYFEDKENNEGNEDNDEESEEDDEPCYYEDNDEESPMTEEEALLLLCREFELIEHGEK
jgi:hypothetical protein